MFNSTSWAKRYLCQQDDISVDAIKRAMAYGTVVASFTIEKFSIDRLAQIDRAQIDARLAQYANYLNIGG